MSSKITLAMLQAKGYDVRVLSADYTPVEATINDGLADQAVNFNGLIVVTSAEIINDDATRAFTVKLNGQSKEFTVAAGETKIIDETLITAISLSNSSGGNIDYRILLWGFSQQF